MDECLDPDAVCDINANCSNTYGSYFCTCRTGYTGDGLQCNGKFFLQAMLSFYLIYYFIVVVPDIDECDLGLDVCHPNATCHNTPGAYNCTCNTGFAGDGFTCTGMRGYHFLNSLNNLLFFYRRY